MADRRRLLIPREFAESVREAGVRVDVSLPVDFAQAAEAARLELGLLREAEGATGRDLHKGHPIYNVGITLYPRRPNEARGHFEAAFVEDARTYEAPQRHLAGRLIRRLIKAPARLLRDLAQKALRNPRRDPFEVAAEVDQDFDLADYEPLFPQDQPDDWLYGTGAEDLVFVGGSYGRGGDRIFQIAEQVAACGLHPVIVGLFKRRPGESDRQKSFRVLDLCGLAAFDGTEQEKPGWWSEVERIAQGRQIPTLIAYFSTRSTYKYGTSAMFPTPLDHPRLSTRPFGLNLSAVVAKWLQEECGGRVDCYDPSSWIGIPARVKHSLSGEAGT